MQPNNGLFDSGTGANLTQRAAYLHGWRTGALTRTYMSRREVLERWPGYTHEEAECFLNGMDMGVAS